MKSRNIVFVEPNVAKLVEETIASQKKMRFRSDLCAQP